MRQSARKGALTSAMQNADLTVSKSARVETKR